MAFYEVNPNTQRDLWIYDLKNDKASEYYVSEFNERSPIFSPDGNWIAYISDEGGENNIWVKPYPGTSTKYQVTTTTEGGFHPFWGKDGKEIIYRVGTIWYSISVEFEPLFRKGIPELLFGGSYSTRWIVTPYDYDAEHDKFLMVKNPGGVEYGKIMIKTNWFEELKEKFKDENK